MYWYRGALLTWMVRMFYSVEGYQLLRPIEACERTMSLTPAACGRVLHVTDDVDGVPEDVSQCLRAGGAEVTVCADVYQATVWLGRGETPAFDAVVVNLDWLTSGEFEFVSIVRSMPTPYPVFVYARAESAEKIDRALLMDATGTVDGTDEGVAAVLEVVRVREDSESQDEADAGEARVPWRENGQKPERVPPPEVIVDSGEAVDPDAPIVLEDDDPHEAPLLSSEEIECLIFGDIDDGSTEIERGGAG
jgi:hypothetical protein